MSSHEKLPFACGSYGVLTRDQANLIVEGHTFMHEQYQAVSYDSCRQIIGDRIDLLLSDPIRCKGPTKETVYPWNLVDYMIHKNPRYVARKTLAANSPNA